MDSSSKEPPYAELLAWSNFSFLKSTAHPETLVSRAESLGYSAIAIMDECSLAGCVRAYCEAKNSNVMVMYGSTFLIEEGLYLGLIAKNKQGYGDICALISQCRKYSKKGQYDFSLESLSDVVPANVIAVLAFMNRPAKDKAKALIENSSVFLRSNNFAVNLIVNISYQHGEREWNAFLEQEAADHNIAICASNMVRMVLPNDKPLLDLLYAIDRNQVIDEIGDKIEQNCQFYLKPKKVLYHEYKSEWLARSHELASQCTFNLKEIVYQYPSEVVSKDKTPCEYLRELVEEGAKSRWPNGVIDRVRALIEHELKLIEEMQYEFYFLTVYDVVKYAKERGILCQGRGSAANSVVCFCLGVTEVDPAEMDLLFERFISKERSEPPDIDIDFENARREEVLQYLYNKYGRDRAALTATVITYREKSAYRDTAKALGYDTIALEKLSKSFKWRDRDLTIQDRLEEAGFNTKTRKVQWLISLAEQVKGFPRHLSQHVGGMVICHGRLDKMVPIENAAMINRTVIQWDKDDIDALGILKIDCLALGMLTAIQRALGSLRERLQRPDFDLSSIPKGDAAVYDMMCCADTVGVFQIESRAQMSMLPRLRPRNFYDLVIQVSIVRPGPIQGDMVHPYLRRRQKIEPVTYPSKDVEQVLKRTLGVPIFQEQVIKLAMVAAGFSAGEADHLRRSMAAWRRSGNVEQHKERLIKGMLSRGYKREYADQIFNQIRGFGEYGFPESHAASFAILVYYSCWIKYHYPDIFITALLNSQPMGFYRAAQLVIDARQHGVAILAPDLLKSQWQTTSNTPMVVQLGFHQIKGFKQEEADKIVLWRQCAINNKKRIGASSKFNSSEVMDSLKKEAGLQQTSIELLAKADALRDLSTSRHHSLWQALAPTPSVLINKADDNVVPLLPMPTKWQESIADYRYTRINQKNHPLQLLRPELQSSFGNLYIKSSNLKRWNNRTITTIGLIINRQRPGKGNVLFMTLEDEAGWINCVFFSDAAKAFRKEIMRGQLLEVTGKIQVEREVIHLIVTRARDRSYWIEGEFNRSRDFH